jgi:hypothetical protein
MARRVRLTYYSSTSFSQIFLIRSTIAHVDRPRPTGPTHSFSRTVDPESPRASPKITAPKSPKLRSKRSQVLQSDSDGENANGGSRPPSRKHSFSLTGRKNSMRKRSDSGATEKSTGGTTEREDGERGKDKAGKRKSKAGWGMSWGNKSGVKSKEKFASLRGDRGSDEESEDDDRRSAKSNKVGRSPKAPARLIHTASAASMERKRVRATFDYAAAADDELSFRTGDEIKVINETSDAWWTGELAGRQGLFPTSYVSPLPIPDTRKPPMPPRRPSAPGSPPEEAVGGFTGPVSQLNTGASASTETDMLSDVDHPFGDHLLVTHRTPVYASFDQHSFTSSAADDTESDTDERPVLSKRSPMAEQQILTKAPAPPPGRPAIPSRQSTNAATSSPSVSSVSVSSAAASIGKKAPPPPPPRRGSIYGTPSTSGSVGTPPIPARALPPSISRSSSAASAPISAQALAAAMAAPTESPFDSTTDLMHTGSCREFKQNPFKARGMCANCFEQHG